MDRFYFGPRMALHPKLGLLLKVRAKLSYESRCRWSGYYEHHGRHPEKAAIALACEVV